MSGALHVQDLLDAASARQAREAAARRPVRPGVVLGWTAVSVLFLAIAWGGASWACAGKVPRATSVAGVDVSGMSRAQAQAAVSSGLARATARPVAVVIDGGGAGSEGTGGGAGAAGARRGTLDPRAAGLALDVPATVDAAIGRTAAPLTLWHAVAGGGAVAPVSTVDPRAMATALHALSAADPDPAVEGGIRFDAGHPVTVAPRTGRALAAGAAADALRREWLTTGPVHLPTVVLRPTVLDGAVADALSSTAGPAAAGPITVAVGSSSVVLDPQAFTPALAFVPDHGALTLHVDGATLAAAVLAADPSAVTAPVDAALSTGGGSGAPTVVPAVEGTRIDPAALAQAAPDALRGATQAARTLTATLAPQPAAVTTEAVTALGVTAQLAEQATALTADPARTQDVATAAAALDGTLVQPGDTLSLASVLGVPGPDTGYTAAPVVSGGRLASSFAAGVPQVAATLYAAAMSAGLTDTQHTAHAWYDPRYPAGLDATADLPSVDLRVTNGTRTAVLVASWLDGGQLHVRLWGTADLTVAESTGPRTDIEVASAVADPSPRCVPEPGSDGFAVTVTRTLTRGDAVVSSDDTTTHYARHDAVVCTDPIAALAPPSLAVGD